MRTINYEIYERIVNPRIYGKADQPAASDWVIARCYQVASCEKKAARGPQGTY